MTFYDCCSFVLPFSKNSILTIRAFFNSFLLHVSLMIKWWQIIFSLQKDGTFTTISSLTFKASHYENGKTIYCFAENDVMQTNADPELKASLILDVRCRFSDRLIDTFLYVFQFQIPQLSPWNHWIPLSTNQQIPTLPVYFFSAFILLIRKT